MLLTRLPLTMMGDHRLTQLEVSMFKRTLLLTVVLAALAGSALAEDFTATTWDDALAKSTQHDKPILIDFFTEW